MGVARSPLIPGAGGGASAPLVPRFVQPGAARRLRGGVASAWPGRGLPSSYLLGGLARGHRGGVVRRARACWDGAEAAPRVRARLPRGVSTGTRIHSLPGTPPILEHAGGAGRRALSHIARLGGTEASRGLGGATRGRSARVRPARAVSPQYAIDAAKQTRQAKLGY